MKINYKSEKLKQQLNDKNYMDAKFGQGVHEAFCKLKDKIASATSIGNLHALYKHGVNVEKIKGHKNIGSLRVNIKVRIFFSYEEGADWLTISEIIIVDISNDNHGYK